MRKSTPRIPDASVDFFEANFRTLNAGAEYVLEAFSSLYKRTLYELTGYFAPSELSLMLDVFNGTILTSGLAGRRLASQCADGIKYDGFGEKWGVDTAALTKKLENLTSFESAVMEIWAVGFWRGENLDIETHIKPLAK